MPSSSAGKEVGDIVQTPDAPIKSWRYLGGGKWEPNDAVRYTTGPGGVVGNRLPQIKTGARREAANWIPGVNQLVNRQPMQEAMACDRDGATKWSAVVVTGGCTIEGDTERTCPITGLPTAKVTLVAGVTGAQRIDWAGLNITPDPDDVWMISVWIPYDTPNPDIEFYMYGTATTGTGTWRVMRFMAERFHPGWNILTISHVEKFVGATEYGVVDGTDPLRNIQIGGGMTESTPVQAIRLNIRDVDGLGRVFHVGGVFRAKRGWATPAVIWMFDDVGATFYERGLPIIEEYGWKATLCVTSGYAAEPRVTYMSLDQVLDAQQRGHEIWGHLRLHENITSTPNPERALREAQRYWTSRGIQTAAQCMAWPFGAYNAAGATLAKQLGYKLARGINGQYHSPIAPGVAPYTFGAYNLEKENSWHIDAMINGAIRKGLALFTYGHRTEPGGAGINVRPPDGNSHYTDHLRRWCDIVKAAEQRGECVVPTALEWFRLCGIDPLATTFVE